MTGARRERVLVLGGSSDIARALVRSLGASGTRSLVLAGRDRARLEQAAAEASAQRVELIEFDARDTGGHAAVLRRAQELLGEIDLVVLAVGVLGDGAGAAAALADPAGSLDVLEVNGVGATSLLLHAAATLRAQGSGTVVVLSSAGAVRPRASNAVYGAAKAALDSLALALADELRASAVRVVIVRPGFVRTRMTAGLRPPPLSTDPQRVARATIRGLDGGAGVIWVPRAMAVLMALLRMLPRPLYARLPL